MKFLFKINSGYDGFVPQQLPQRMVDGSLELGWGNYIEAVEPGDEVWVYYKGPHRFENGVYARGRVGAVDDRSRRVLLTVHEYAVDRPLIGDPLAGELAAVVRTPYRQVFLVPEALPVSPDCSVASTAASCGRRLCEDCPVWRSLPVIQHSDLGWPGRLPEELSVFAPAYWAVARRSVAYGRESPAVAATSELFGRFKVGERRLAFPLALGVRTALRHRGVSGVDALVPIPLSPDKVASGELHRTEALAEELRLLTGYPVTRLLRLSAPISKRALGVSAARFEDEYAQRLIVALPASNLRSVLLVDDVCTNGSTIACAYRALKTAAPSLAIGAVTAAQMTVKSAVANLASVSRHGAA